MKDMCQVRARDINAVVVLGCLIVVIFMGGYLVSDYSNDPMIQKVSKEDGEKIKKSLLGELMPLKAQVDKKNLRNLSRPTSTLTATEVTALVEASIDDLADLFKVDSDRKTVSIPTKTLAPILQNELNRLDGDFIASKPSSVRLSETGRLKAIYPSFGVSNIVPQDTNSIGSSAVTLIDNYPTLFGLNESATVKVKRSNCGRKICTVIVDKHFNGLPAWDHSLTLAANGNQIVSILGEFEAPSVKADPNNQLSKDKFKEIVGAHYQVKLEDLKMTTEPELGIGRVGAHDYIGYRANVDMGSAGRYRVSVNAQTKKVVQGLSLIMEVSVPASGTTLNGDTVTFQAEQAGSTYLLRDDRFPIGYKTSVYSASGKVWHDCYLANSNCYLANSNSRHDSWDPAAVTSIYNTQILMDYYSDNHNYGAINEEGRDLAILVNAMYETPYGLNPCNASWSADTQLMVFGAGNSSECNNVANSLDVHAHEMTHGVISSNSNLTYAFQSGALNEAFADFFGTQLDPEDWNIGEDIYLEGTPLRSMTNPTLYGQPAHMTEYYYKSATDDHGGVHTNSGIPNRAMYLLAEGLTSENLGTSVGRVKAGQIIWDTMLSLNSNATFEDAAIQMIATAGSLFGAGSAEQVATEASWNAVGIPDDGLLISSSFSSNTPISPANTVLYLNPIYDVSTIAPDDNVFNLYGQNYLSTNPSYDPQFNFGPLNSQVLTNARPSFVNLVDGSYVILYQGADGLLYSYLSATGTEDVVDLDGFIISDVTLSADGNILIFSVIDAGLIYRYDYRTDEFSFVEVTGPNYSETTESLGSVEYVDTLRFDPSSRRVIFDYLVCDFSTNSDCSEPTWSIGILDVESLQISYPFPAQSSNIDLGFPSFSNLSPDHITFDLISYSDTNTSSFILIYNIADSSLKVVGYPDTTDEQLGYYGMPSFSANDSGITFAARDDNGVSVLIYAQLQNYQLTTSQPAWLTLNPFLGYAPFSEPYQAYDRDPLLSLDNSSIDMGGVLRGSTASHNLCASNSDLFPIRISQLLDSTNSISWLGEGASLTQGKRVCGDVKFDSNQWPEGLFSKTLPITHDGANSPTPITINAIISDDTDGDGILNYQDSDDDNDSIADVDDAFPLDVSESLDTDGDEIGNNADADDDGDGVEDSLDAFPLDVSESLDTDGDEIGNNADADDDGDGVEDSLDALPLDASESLDTDGDLIGNNADPDDDNDSITDVDDAFPLDAAESVDTDGDKIGDNADPDDDNDGVADELDTFPLDPDEASDTDSDGVGDNSDSFPNNSLYTNDSDNDGMPDSWEARYGLDPNDSSDADSDQDGDGSNALQEFLHGTIPIGSIDIDGNGQYDALTDGLLILRGMFALTGNALTAGAVATDAMYTSSAEIGARIEALGNLLDIDGNDQPDALTDGLIILRYLFGLRGDGLINGVVASDATEFSADNIAGKIDALMPVPTAVLDASILTARIENCFSINEASTDLCSLGDLISENAALTATLVGADSANFKLQSNGSIKFNSAPEYGSPADSNGDNIYDLAVQLSNGVQTISEAIQVEVVSDCDTYVLSAVEDEFRYCWQESQVTPSGHEYSASVNSPLTVEFVGDMITVPDASAAEEIFLEYGIVLSDEGQPWSVAEAYAIKEVLKRIPFKPFEVSNEARTASSKWILSESFIANDIDIQQKADGSFSVSISTAAFTYASPRIARVEGKRGAYFSNRLHHALVRFVTQNGTDLGAVNKILTERYAVSVAIPDYFALTGESPTRFQAFHPQELISIISMFEEMPAGMHKIAGLNYLVRRMDGLASPVYPDAPAIAWVDSGYIEFMESGLVSDSLDYVHRLIVHEKAHFLWGKVFDDALIADWNSVGGWYECTEKSSGWCTTQQAQFVSAYAHLKNPNEDMAESISFFLVNPDQLRSRAPLKYEFVRDRIMQGNLYISQIREDLTFEVFNLYPDYVYPGKIKSIKISVMGGAYEDKTVIVALDLHADQVQLDGATQGQTRITSEAVPETFIDFWMYPPEGRNTGPSSGLVGTFVIPARAKSGYWSPQQIVVWDDQGNSRMSGANDFGWRLYVDNPLEDVTSPRYVSDSLRLDLGSTVIDGETIQTIVATWDFEESNIRASQFCYGALNDEWIGTYSLEQYGDVVDGQCELEFLMPEYMPSGQYRLNFMRMIDIAGNTSRTYFRSPDGIDEGMWNDPNADELSPSVTLDTSIPDMVAPELDVNSILVSALPSNPENPNGETILTIDFLVRDDISGYKLGGFYIRDPQGTTNHYWHYPEDWEQIYPTSPANSWQQYSATVILPAGSPPGIWGLAELVTRDRANNFKVYGFTEIISFVVSDEFTN